MAEAESAEEALAHNAAKAAKLALFCLVVAVLVLAIDHRLKQHIITEGRRALALLEEARKLAEEARDGRAAEWGRAAAAGNAEEARNGAQGTVEGGAVSGVVVNGADGVVHAPGASATPGADARRGARKTPGRPAGES